MKKRTVVLSICGVVMIFGLGLRATSQTAPKTEIEQIHLSCWDEDGSSSFERIRLVLNSQLQGLVWFSTFGGEPTDEGKLTATTTPASLDKNVINLNVLTKGEKFLAAIPSFVFQPHVRQLRVKVEKDHVSSSLECKKINLAKRQSEL